MTESRADIIYKGIEYSEAQFKKVVNVVNETSEKLPLNYPDDISNLCIMSFIARMDGMVQSYKKHAINHNDRIVYNELFLVAFESAEQAYAEKTIVVEEGIKA